MREILAGEPRSIWIHWGEFFPEFQAVSMFPSTAFRGRPVSTRLDALTDFPRARFLLAGIGVEAGIDVAGEVDPVGGLTPGIQATSINKIMGAR